MQDTRQKPRDKRVRPLRYVLGTESARTSHLRQEDPEKAREAQNNTPHQTLATALAVTYRVLHGSPEEGDRRIRLAPKTPPWPAVHQYRD